MKKFISEFKEFISKGNVLDMAVGVIIGGAFSKIVTSLVDNIIMPIVGILIGGHDFTNLTITLKDATISYGTFIQNVVDFLIVAFCIFVFIKAINRLSRKRKKEALKQEEEKKEAPIPPDIQLLCEIRDLLKEAKAPIDSKKKTSKKN